FSTGWADVFKGSGDFVGQRRYAVLIFQLSSPMLNRVDCFCIAHPARPSTSQIFLGEGPGLPPWGWPLRSVEQARMPLLRTLLRHSRHTSCSLRALSRRLPSMVDSAKRLKILKRMIVASQDVVYVVGAVRASLAVSDGNA